MTDNNTTQNTQTETVNQYPFDEEFEQKLLAHLIRDKGFFDRNSSLVREDYFENKLHRDIYRLSSKYVKEYSETIPLEEAKNEIRKMFVSQKKKDIDIDVYFDLLNDLFARDLSGEKYTEDQVIAFARNQEMTVALKDGAKRVLGGKDLKPILANVTKVLEIGWNKNIWETLPTANDIDEDVVDDWLVEKTIPHRSVIVFHGTGGLGKSHLMFHLGNCVAEGKPFFGSTVKQCPVYYVDFENPLSVRGNFKRKLGGSGMRIFSLESLPPKLDSKEWEIYKSFPPGLFIFDSLRASHSLDTNSDKDMALIMNRMKELWAVGHTIILLQHTPRSDDKRSKGSTVITDLADSNLALFRVKAPGEEPKIDDDGLLDPNGPKLLYFGSLPDTKSRYEKHRMYIRFDPNKIGAGEVFEVVQDLNDPVLQKIHQLLVDHINNNKGSREEATTSDCPSKESFIKLINESLGIGKVKARGLIDSGAGKYWKEDRVKVGRQWNFYYFPLVIRGHRSSIDRGN